MAAIWASERDFNHSLLQSGVIGCWGKLGDEICSPAEGDGVGYWVRRSLPPKSVGVGHIAVKRVQETAASQGKPASPEQTRSRRHSSSQTRLCASHVFYPFPHAVKRILALTGPPLHKREGPVNTRRKSDHSTNCASKLGGPGGKPPGVPLTKGDLGGWSPPSSL